MTDIFGLMETHRGYVRVFFEHYRELPDEARREIRVKRDRYEGLIRDAVARGSRRGVPRRRIRTRPRWRSWDLQLGLSVVAARRRRGSRPMARNVDLVIRGLSVQPQQGDHG